MGMMIKNPIRKLSPTSVQNVVGDWLVIRTRIRTKIKVAIRAFKGCCRRKTTGLPLITPCSLANAMTEPEKVMAPMTIPSDISMMLTVWMSPRVPMP